MKVAYVAGPYRAKTPLQVERNILNSIEVAGELWKIGFAALSPQANTALFEHRFPDVPDEVWLEGTMELMLRCDIVVVQGLWLSSVGTKAEMKKAQELKMPVFFWPDDEENIVNWLRNNP